MSKPQPGDVYIVTNTENNVTRLALYVQHGRGVTSGMECGLATGFVFVGRTKARGEFLTKPRSLSASERLVRKCSEQEQRSFRRKCAGMGAGKAVKG